MVLNFQTITKNKNIILLQIIKLLKRGTPPLQKKNSFLLSNYLKEIFHHYKIKNIFLYFYYQTIYKKYFNIITYFVNIF
jgi:hypothetical protein